MVVLNESRKRAYRNLNEKPCNIISHSKISSKETIDLNVKGKQVLESNKGKYPQGLRYRNVS